MLNLTNDEIKRLEELNALVEADIELTPKAWSEYIRLNEEFWRTYYEDVDDDDPALVDVVPPCIQF